MGTNHLRMMDTIENRLYRYRAKRLRFLINGDKFFGGINYALNTEKIRSYDALLNDLTQSLMDHIKICKGVRYIFAQDGSLISSLGDFENGNTYVCSSTDNFISTEYRDNNSPLNRLVRNSACISSRSKQSQNHQNDSSNDNDIINNSQNNNNTSSGTPRLLPTTKTRASHNNVCGSNHKVSQTTINSVSKTTTRSNNTTPNNSANHRTRTPRRAVVDTNLSHNNQVRCNTPQRTKPSTPTNNIDSVKKRIGSQSPQLNAFGNGQQAVQTNNKSTFGGEFTEKYDIGKPIGDGHFSVVYFCMNKTTQEFCALKLIDKQKCKGRDDMIYNEVAILKQLNHPNIVKLIEEFDYPKELYLVLELVQDGDLFDAISTVTRFSEIHVATMIHNLSSALTYLHKQGIVHRDIKPENLLISVQDDGSHSLKLADFGLAVKVGDTPLYSVCGTAFYVSPEMLNEVGYDYKVDVWSTGVICFILLCGYPPFTSENESNQDELFDAILAGDLQFAPPYWSKISQHAKNLIKSMLIVDPEQRYSAEQVFQHPWTMGISSNFEGIDPMNTSRKIALVS